MKREKLLETVKDLPQEFEMEELLQRLIFVDKENFQNNFPNVKYRLRLDTIRHDKTPFPFGKLRVRVSATVR